MIRTIAIKTVTTDCIGVTYRDEYLGELLSPLNSNLGLEDGKFRISITKNKNDRGDIFKLYPRFRKSSFYIVERNGMRIGAVCRSKFDKLFFKPTSYIRYRIIIKKVG